MKKEKKEKVGILTWHYFLNFGSALQAYALKQSIEKLGYSVDIINYRNPKHGVPSFFKDAERLITSKLFFNKGYFLGRQITYPFLRFHFDYLKLGKAFSDIETLKKQIKKHQTIVCGSDQIWAPNIVDDVYLLKYVPDSIKKISYAASIGFDYIPAEKMGMYKENINRFYAVSVRESKGKELLEKHCGIKASVVLDPTLLVNVEHWNSISREPTELNLDIQKEYVFCYFLNQDNCYLEKVLPYARENGCQVVGYSLKEGDHEMMTDVTGKIGPREFLWLVNHAKAVATDSYHGTIFSLLNHKNVFVFERFSKDDPICQNSRIEQLNQAFSLSDCFINDTKMLTNSKIDYENFEKKLEQLRKQSFSFLTTALKRDN